MALAADALARIHDRRVDFVTSPDAPPGLSRDIEGGVIGCGCRGGLCRAYGVTGASPRTGEGVVRGRRSWMDATSWIRMRGSAPVSPTAGSAGATEISTH